MRIAVRWADEFNLTGATPERAAERFARLDEACRAAGRDPSSLARSVMVGVLIGRDRDEVVGRSRALVELVGADGDAEEWFVSRRARWVYGTPDEARETIARYGEAGARRIMLQDMLPWDLEMVDLLGRELVGRA
jgi:alkanesulfonate monooxygenase SsuD/methylene tetrahydromethanopterin reductase-like flavin-dependent oxidoreductase (luciferase family)